MTSEAFEIDIEQNLEKLKIISPHDEISPTYAIFQEIFSDSCEVDTYFIKFQGNENALIKLQKDLDKIKDWPIDDDSIFEIDVDANLSAETVREMCGVSISKFRKFDGVMKEVDFGFSPKKEKQKEMLKKIYEKLSDSGILEYISEEDVI